jgi:hypothetical protein
MFTHGPSRHFASLIKVVAFGREEDVGSSGSRSSVPAKTDGRGMPPDDSAESTGERLDARYPNSRTGHKRILSHRWGSQGLFSLVTLKRGANPIPFVTFLQQAKPDRGNRFQCN